MLLSIDEYLNDPLADLNDMELIMAYWESMPFFYQLNNTDDEETMETT